MIMIIDHLAEYRNCSDLKLYRKNGYCYPTWVKWAFVGCSGLIMPHIWLPLQSTHREKCKYLLSQILANHFKSFKKAGF